MICAGWIIVLVHEFGPSIYYDDDFDKDKFQKLKTEPLTMST